MPPTIYDYILQEKARFETDRIQLGENWYWNFREHVQLIFHLKHNVFYTGDNNWVRPFKQVMKTMIQLCNWTEDIEARNVMFYLKNGGAGMRKVWGFLIKKYHEDVYAKEHDLDQMLDDITDSDNSYGGALVQPGMKRPEVLSLNSIAFCDQTNIKGGAIGFGLYLSPSKLKSMSKLGWGEESNGATISLEELCTLATYEKDPQGTMNEKQNRVPSKTIEVYVVKGDLPENYLKEGGDEDYVYNQVQVVAYYNDKERGKTGVTLYRKKNEDDILFHSTEPVFMRALGFSAGETSLYPQIFSNFLTIHKTNLLEASAKVPLFTDDPSYANRNKVQDMENLEITTISPDSKFGIAQIPTAAPANIQLIGAEINEWFNVAQYGNAAFDPLMGAEKQTSGTTFRGQERVVAQGKGSHENKKGKRAKFVEEIYRKLILPDIIREIKKGKKFLANLDVDELSWVAEQVSTHQSNEKIKGLILKGKVVSLEEAEQFRQMYRKDFLKKGNKQLLEILKDELPEDLEIEIGVNVEGKQKDVAQLSDKLLSIFQFIFQNPQGFQQAMQIPALAKSFESIVEYGGLSITDFSSLMQAPMMSTEVSAEAPKPLEMQPA